MFVRSTGLGRTLLRGRIGKVVTTTIVPATLEEAANDDYRFPADYWGADVWNVESR